MNLLEFNKNQFQMDYFSDSYRKFEEDFYRFSSLDIPLTFLTNDIMLAMAKSQKNYFKLNKENSKDHRDHYFLFNVEPSKENSFVKMYQYTKSTSFVEKNKENGS